MLRSPCSRAGLCFLGLSSTFAAAPLSAQLPKRLPAELVRTVDVSTIGITPSNGQLRVSASGHLLLTAVQGEQVLFASADGKRLAQVGKHGDGAGEFLTANWIGRVGLSDSLWIADAGLGRAMIFGPDLRVVREFPLPLVLNGGGIPWQSRPRPPALLGMLGDGSLLLSITGNLPSTGFSQLGPALVRVKADGNVINLPRLPEGWGSPCPRSIPVPGTTLRVAPFFCNVPRYAFATMLPQVVLTATPKAMADSVVLVTRLTLAGDTIFRQMLGLPAVRVTAQQIDSVAAAIMRDPDPALSKLEVRQMDSVYRVTAHRTHPSVLKVIACSDGTSWLELSTNEVGHLWLGLDGKGAPFATTLVPPAVRISSGSHDRLWGFETTAARKELAVQYLVGVDAGGGN